MSTILSSAAVLFRNTKRSLLYGSMAVLTIGLEELIESVVFNCPCEGHLPYGLAFLWAPALLLFLAGIMVDSDLWKLARIKKKNMTQSPGRRYLKVFLAAPYIFVNAGIAPVAWLVISFLQQQYYTCAYFGPPLDSEVELSNATDKCRVTLGFRTRELEESCKTRSQITGWSLMLVAVLILFTSVCIRRCFRKRKELKLPSLEYYQYKEAEAALKEFHTMAKEYAKQNAKENVEKSFNNAKIKRFDARIQTVANDVVQRYGMYFVIPSSESPAVRPTEPIRPQSLSLQLPHCGFEVIDGPPIIAKSNVVESPSRSAQGVHFSETSPPTCDWSYGKQAVSKVTLHRQNAVIETV